MGLAFAFGWTPCVGPILAAILFMAAAKETAGQGAHAARALRARNRHPFCHRRVFRKPFHCGFKPVQETYG
jgi:cytochrome c-type biogenesis protein